MDVTRTAVLDAKGQILVKAADERIIQRFEELLELGEKVLETGRRDPLEFDSDLVVDGDLAEQWITSSLSLLRRVFGADSSHFLRFNDYASDMLTYTPVHTAMGILRAAVDDIRSGSLFDVRQLIHAEVFDEFLEQAQHLFESGYHGPSAVVAGTVLEDGLRQLCEQHGVPLSDKPKLDRMNADLARAGVYNGLRQKQITALAAVRNDAAHGRWNEFSPDDVRRMIDGVRSFTETHFA